MRHHQRGVTFLGWLFLLLPIGLVLYAGIRLTPIYLEYMKIARTLDQVSKEFRGEQADAPTLRNAIEKRFDIESVTALTIRDTDKLKISRDGGKYMVQVIYSQSAPFLSNISLQANFDKTVTVE